MGKELRETRVRSQTHPEYSRDSKAAVIVQLRFKMHMSGHMCFV